MDPRSVARVERSEVFTSGFVPELDQSIDAWPDATKGFHAVENGLFGSAHLNNDRAVDALAAALVRDLGQLNSDIRKVSLTPQGLLNGLVRLAYEIGESKVDGGKSRLSGTSLDDMRHNIEGIEAAYRIIFSPMIATRNSAIDAAVRERIDALKAMLAVTDLRQIDPDRLRMVSEELVVTVQDAAPFLKLEKPTLEEKVL